MGINHAAFSSFFLSLSLSLCLSSFLPLYEPQSPDVYLFPPSPHPPVTYSNPITTTPADCGAITLYDK